jgi:L-alanine-DL-glutamate epimerase-like enolase superfamily enzyme
MKVSGYEIFCADAGYCNAWFLKLLTDEGLVGWSEFGEHSGTPGLAGIVRQLCDLVIGMDPTEITRIAAFLRGRTVQTLGGMSQHATAAIVNALFDIKGKSAGLPVHALFGGAVRMRVPVYWSHCTTYRMIFSEIMGTRPVRTLPDVTRLGEEVRARGIRAIKAGMVDLQGDVLVNFGQGFANGPGFVDLNLEAGPLKAVVAMMEALRVGAGPDVQLLLDVNCHFTTEGYLRLVRALENLDLYWLELDIFDPAALATIRRAASFPIASLEAVYGRKGIRPYLDAQAADVAIVDVVWNGYLEACKMADLVAAYEVNVAPHCYTGGGLGDVMSTHFAAAIPNLRIMEYDFDEVPWKRDFLSHPLVLDNGDLIVPTGPGWGVEVNEAALRAHPPR